MPWALGITLGGLTLLWIAWNLTLDALWQPTDPVTMRRLLTLSEIKPGETLIDLGCGDGRFVVAAAKEFGARATGFEIDPFRVLYAKVWIWLARRNLNPSTPFKFGLGLILLGVGFFMMVIASKIVASGQLALPTWLILTYLFHTFGELAISPVGLSATTKLAPQRYVGQMMGIWFVGAALGNLIAGQVAGDFDPNDIAAFPAQYWQIVMTAGGAGLIFLVLSRPIRKLMGGVH